MRARHYHNENNPYAAQWLRNLMARGLIAPGEVDERSIADVSPDDLRGFVQCHFFAGLGGWSLALQVAGWPDDRPVWTGSCPCQPGSVAGKQEGFDDPRHLWPVWLPLIRERRPATVFGEQVAGWSDWLGLVRGDLEALGYAVGAMPIEAASAGADHFRDRYWFVADCHGESREWDSRRSDSKEAGERGQRQFDGNLLDGFEPRCEGLRDRSLADSPIQGEGRRGLFGPAEGAAPPFQRPSDQSSGHRNRPLVDDSGLGWGEGWTESEFRRRGFTASVASIGDRQYVECPDGKWRRLPPPRVRWLGNGIPARVARLRALGNAIDHRPAAKFIAASMDCLATAVLEQSR